MTDIYFIRHSKTLKTTNIFNSDSLQIQNEKQILSLEGEELAKNKLDIDELKNLDYLVSSNYIRAISTAKYLAFYNNIDINIIEAFGERKFGIDSWDELDKAFYSKQISNYDYKIKNGESRRDVETRMSYALDLILDKCSNKRVAIVTHSTALLFLLMKYCQLIDNKLYFNEKCISDLEIDNCSGFKLVFDNKKLINICKI